RSFSDQVYEEYVVERVPPPELVAVGSSLSEEALPNPQQEYNFDLLNASPVANDPPAVSAPSASVAPGTPNAEFTSPHSESETPRQPAPDASDDDFIADMKAILNGEKVYDGTSKKTRSRDEAPLPPATAPSEPQFSNGQAIFDKIAEN